MRSPSDNVNTFTSVSGNHRPTLRYSAYMVPVLMLIYTKLQCRYNMDMTTRFGLILPLPVSLYASGYDFE